MLSQCEKIDLFDDKCYDDGCIIYPALPVVPFDYSSIAFIARITPNSADWSLCVMDKSGNNMQKIFDGTVACQKPVRSNCGTQLLFRSVVFEYWTNPDNSFGSSSEFSLHIVNTDGTGLTLIDHIGTHEIGNFGGFDWSPDDKYIVYVKHSEGYTKRELILYNVSNKTHTVLRTEGNICTPQFSPNGRQIAYCAIVESDPIFMNSHRNHHIFVIDVDGKNNRLLIREGSSPRWSPQGDRIAYISSGELGSSQIFVASACGHNQRQLTTTISPQRWPGPYAPGGNSDPQWTPDGKKIVYVSQENERSEIFIMNADGSNQTRLTTAEFHDNTPEVTPDGKYILFSSRRSDTMEGGIIKMTLDGKNQRVISNTGIYPIACR